MDDKSRFVVEMEDLKRHVGFQKQAVTKMDLGTSLVRFELKSGSAELFSSDREIALWSELKFLGELEGPTRSFAIQSSKLEKLVSQVEAETAAFIVDDEGVEIQVGLLTVSLEILDASVLGAIKKGVEKDLRGEGKPLTKELLEEALVCAKACSTDQAVKPDITHVELRAGRVLFSDGRKIMMYEAPFDPTASLKVPSTSLAATAQALKQTTAEQVVLGESEAFYFLRSTGKKLGRVQFTVGVRKTEKSFPKIESQLESLGNGSYSDKIAVDKFAFESMVRGVSVGLKDDEVRVDVTISGEGTTATMEVAALNSINRKSFERASCGRQANSNLAFPISFKHLLDTLSVFKGDSVVDLGVAFDKNLLVILDVTPTRKVTTVIPFRTKAAVEEEKRAADEKKKACAKTKKADSVEPEEVGEITK